jgi:exodeoxyribonuclease VII large subunit
MHRPLEQRGAELPRIEGPLRRAAALSLALQRQRTSGLAGRLQALDPARVLQRGYAWVTDDAGRAVVSVRQMQIGARLQAVLADGTAAVTVTDVAPSGIERLQRQPE